LAISTSLHGDVGIGEVARLDEFHVAAKLIRQRSASSHGVSIT
jgi:hypothetical protein